MIPSDNAHLHLAAASDPGMSGKNNEDRYVVLAHQLSKVDLRPSLLAIIADGVGGHNAGEIAAEIAVETIGNIISTSDPYNPIESLKIAITKADKKILEQSQAAKDLQGMGSTCVCVWIIDNQLYTASVGDSRIYLIRNDRIKQVTKDHTWIQEALDHGIIQPEQVRNHPRAHVILRYLGSKNPVEADFRMFLNDIESDFQAKTNQGVHLLPNDQILLCSDGLTDLVNDNEILEVLKNESLDHALQTLVDIANIRGGHDNITMLALRVPHSDSNNANQKSRTPYTSKNKDKLRRILRLIILVILMIILVSLVYFYSSQTPSEKNITSISVVLNIPPITETPIDEISSNRTPIPYTNH